MTASLSRIEQLAPWLAYRFACSAGPGGQNVNKVHTRVTLLFDFEACQEISPSHKNRILHRLATRLARDGRLRVVSQRERTQHANRRRAQQRLLELHEQATQRPTARKPTGPWAAARKRLLRTLRPRGQIKRFRQNRPGVED